MLEKEKTKAVHVHDLDIYIVELDSGKYSIDGTDVVIDGYQRKTIEVKDISSIKRILATSKIVGFKNKYDEEMTTEEHKALIEKLTKNGIYDDEYSEYSFPDGFEMDQVEYIKYRKASWRAQYEKGVEYKDVELNPGRIFYSTGSAYIKPMCFASSGISVLYEYNRNTAVCAEILSTFKRFGMERKDYISKAESILKKKFIITDSRLNGGKFHFLEAFGKFPFIGWIPQNGFRDKVQGTLQDCLDMEKADKARVSKIITDEFNLCYRKYDVTEADVPEMIKSLENAQLRVGQLDLKKASLSIMPARENIAAVINMLRGTLVSEDIDV